MIYINSAVDLANLIYNQKIIPTNKSAIHTLETFKPFKIYFVISGGTLNSHLEGKFITCDHTAKTNPKNSFNIVWINSLSKPLSYATDFEINCKESVLVIDIMDMTLFSLPLSSYLRAPLVMTKDDDLRLALISPVRIEGMYNKEIFTVYSLTKFNKLRICVVDKLDYDNPILSDTEINWANPANSNSYALENYVVSHNSSVEELDSIKGGKAKTKGEFLEMIFTNIPTEILVDNHLSPTKTLRAFFNRASSNQVEVLFKLFTNKDSKLENYIMFEDIVRIIFNKEDFMSLEQFATAQEAGMAYALRSNRGVSLEDSVDFLRTVKNILQADYKHFAKFYNLKSNKQINISYEILEAVYETYRNELIFGSHPSLIGFESIIKGYCMKATVEVN